jgi:ABC-type transport system involved in multi-copper enzyme maturation permease subunit
MLLIELRKILREGIIIVLILTAVMVHILTTDRDPMAASVIFEILLLLYASFTGWSIFDRERQEGAEEYMLSMPISRTRLFFLKFIPRLFIVLLLLGAYLLLHYSFDFPSPLERFDFSLIYMAFFLVSLSFSLSIKNFIGALFITSFLSLGLTMVVKILDPAMPESSAILTVNLGILLFPIVFFILFQRFDVKPLGAFNRRFAPTLIVIIVILLGLSWLSTSGYGWGVCYLNEKGDVLRYSCQGSQLVRHNGEIVNLKGCTVPLRQSGDIIYMQARKVEDTCRLKALVNLDMKEGIVRHIMDAKPGWATGIGLAGKNGVLLKGIYYNVYQNPDENQVKILMLKGTHATTIPVYGNFYGKSVDELFHVAENPLQFFVKSDSRIFRVFKSGEAEELPFRPEDLAVWKNRLLVFEKDEMTLYNISHQLEPIFQRKGKKLKKLRRKFGTYSSPQVLFREERGFFLFNLEDQTLRGVDIGYRPYYYFVSGDTLYLVWVKIADDILILSRLENGVVKKIKKWQMTLTKEKGWRAIIPSPWGVVVCSHKSFEKFMFFK